MNSISQKKKHEQYITKKKHEQYVTKKKHEQYVTKKSSPTCKQRMRMNKNE